MLVNLNHLFKQHNNYAIAGFNVYGYEDAVSVIKAAENLKEPVILMVNRDAENHIPLDIIGPMLISLAASDLRCCLTMRCSMRWAV